MPARDLEREDLVPGVTVPALGLLEFSGIAPGIRAGDAMVKKAPVRALVAGSVQPGKFLVLVDGDVASVEEALAAGTAAAAGAVTDRLFLADVHPAVGNAVAGMRYTGAIEALGVIETRTTPSVLRAADAGMKGAAVELVEVRLADGLGGQGLCLFAGELADVEAAVEIAVRAAGAALLDRAVITRLHGDMAAGLRVGSRFGAQWGRGGD